MVKVEQNKKVIIFFNWMVAFSPLLSIYGINGVSLADGIFIAFIFYFFLIMLKYNKPVKISYKLPILFLVYLFIATLLSPIVQDTVNSINIINRFGKYIYYWFLILFMFPYFINKKELFKGYRIIALISCVGILIQYFGFYLFGFYLELKIPLISYVNDSMNGVNFSEIRTNDFRPSSIFLEPAHFTVITILHLTILLFHQHNYKYKYLEIIFISICIMLSTSSTALILLSVLWIIYIFKNFVKWRTHLTPAYVLILLIVTLFIITPLFINTEHVYTSMERISDPDSPAVTGRINAGDYLVESMTGVDKLFGVGFGNFSTYEYMNSINYLLYCAGFIGISILGIVILVAFFKTGLLGKIILILFTFLCFSSPIVISINIIGYSALIYCSYIDNKKKKFIRKTSF